MRYLLAQKNVIEAYAFASGRICSSVSCVLNEKEVMSSTRLEGTLEDRARKLYATIYSNSEIKNIIKKGGYKYE